MENIEKSNITSLGSVGNRGRISIGPSKVEETHRKSNLENGRKMNE